jgi:phosphoglycolate phosphatase-like HAD superfamily hydrolase
MSEQEIRELVRVEINQQVGPVLRNILEALREAKTREERIEAREDRREKRFHDAVALMEEFSLSLARCNRTAAAGRLTPRFRSDGRVERARTCDTAGPGSAPTTATSISAQARAPLGRSRSTLPVGDLRFRVRNHLRQILVLRSALVTHLEIGQRLSQ